MDTKSLMADLTLLSLPGFRLNYMTDKKITSLRLPENIKNLLLYFYDFDF